MTRRRRRGRPRRAPETRSGAAPLVPGGPAARRAALALVVTLASGCDPTDSPAPPPADAPPAGVLLEVGDLQVTFAEVEAYDAYLDSVDERMGRLSRLASLLDRHLLPMKMAQRAFPGERAARREQAEAMLRAVRAQGGAYPQLRRAAANLLPDDAPTHWGRGELPLPVARHVFDTDRLGRVSEVIEVAQGFCLAATYDIERGETRIYDRAEACLVPFYTHDAAAFDAWIREAREALAGKTVRVHPDYRPAVPHWLQ